jgi:hypothetical protein
MASHNSIQTQEATRAAQLIRGGRERGVGNGHILANVATSLAPLLRPPINPQQLRPQNPVDQHPFGVAPLVPTSSGLWKTCHPVPAIVERRNQRRTGFPTRCLGASAESRFLFAGAACVPWRNSPEPERSVDRRSQLRKDPEPRTRRYPETLFGIRYKKTHRRSRQSQEQSPDVQCQPTAQSRNGAERHRSRASGTRRVRSAERSNGNVSSPCDAQHHPKNRPTSNTHPHPPTNPQSPIPNPQSGPSSPNASSSTTPHHPRPFPYPENQSTHRSDAQAPKSPAPQGATDISRGSSAPAPRVREHPRSRHPTTRRVAPREPTENGFSNPLPKKLAGEAANPRSNPPTSRVSPCAPSTATSSNAPPKTPVSPTTTSPPAKWPTPSTPKKTRPPTQTCRDSPGRNSAIARHPSIAPGQRVG